MSPDRGAADRLANHLDAVVSGGVTRSHDLDPAIGATVERFFATDDAPGPPPGLAQHIWEELMDHAASVELGPPIPISPPAPNGHLPFSTRHTAPPTRGPSALTYLATAALVLLSLIGGFVAIRGSLRLLGPENPAVVIPAIDDTPGRVLPAGVIADDILLRKTMEPMPSSEGPPQISLNRYRLAPGAVQPAGAQADTGVGPDLFTVESGQITVEADGSVFLTRAANAATAPSPVPAGTAIVLDVGDQLYAPGGVSLHRRNDGSAEATILDLSIGTIGNQWRTAIRGGVTYDSGFPYFKTLTTSSALPAEATVRRLTLAPGAELPVRDLPGLELVYVETGVLDLVYARAETPLTPEQTFAIRAGSGAEAFGRTPDRAVLANRGAEPVVILTASVMPNSAGAPTPQASVSDGWGTGDQNH
jgi:hypothetical protein